LPVGAGSPEPSDALVRLEQDLATGQVEGLVIVTFTRDGAVEARHYGEVHRHSMAMAGLILTDDAVHGDYGGAEQAETD
jgi:hypothetical protein